MMSNHDETRWDSLLFKPIMIVVGYFVGLFVSSVFFPMFFAG